MLDKSRINTLLKIDPDRYRAALLGSREQRDRLCVIYAFHGELAKIPEIVSEPMIGAIRYQWWRDAIDEIYSGKPVRQHDIAVPLVTVIEQGDLSRFQLDSLINGRERDLDPTPFEDLGQAREYCRETSGRIMAIAAQITQGHNEQSDLLLDLGECWGMTGLARSWRYYNSGMLSKLNFSELLDDIKDRYESARKAIGSVSPDLIPAIAYGALIPGYLKIMCSDGYSPENHVPNYSQIRKKMRLLRSTISGKI